MIHRSTCKKPEELPAIYETTYIDGIEFRLMVNRCITCLKNAGNVVSPERLRKMAVLEFFARKQQPRGMLALFCDICRISLGEAREIFGYKSDLILRTWPERGVPPAGLIIMEYVLRDKFDLNMVGEPLRSPPEYRIMMDMKKPEWAEAFGYAGRSAYRWELPLGKNPLKPRYNYPDIIRTVYNCFDWDPVLGEMIMKTVKEPMPPMVEIMNP